jgi:hypothetical protein
VKLGIVLATGGVMAMAFNYWLARTPIISGTEGWFLATGLDQLEGTFFHPEHGLFYFVPWTLIALLAIARAFRSDAPPDSGFLRQMALPLALYLVLLSSFGSGPGLCYGPRFWVPFMPWLALATIAGLNHARRPALIACGLMVLLAAIVAIPGAVRYQHMFSQPPWAALKARNPAL